VRIEKPEHPRYKDKHKPILFTLHKLGPMEPLVWVDNKRRKLPVDGTPYIIALDSENGKGTHQIEFRLRSERAMQLNKNEPFTPGQYAWDFEMKIPGGGFIASKSDFNLEAPDQGYQERIRISYTKETPNWRQAYNGKYFVRFSDGTHGRIKFSIYGDTNRSPLWMSSWFNAKPGSRNLTTDKYHLGDVLTEE